MKKKLIICFCLFYALTLKAQAEAKVSTNLFKIDILTPGLTFEKSINNNSTLLFDASTSIGYVEKNNAGSIIMTSLLKTQYRYYYNFSNRLSKNKNITGNSGNFISAFSSYYFKPFGNDNHVSGYDGLTIGSTWGLQRTYISGLNINLSTGLGYNFSNQISDNTSPIVPIINFTIGWVLFDKKK